MKIRVAYDVSFCADLFAGRDNVTGVGRVIENVARHLASSTEVELLLTGCRGGDYQPALTSARARHYWEQRWPAGWPFLESVQSRTGLFPAYGASLVKANAVPDETASVPGRFRRKALNGFTRWDARPARLDGQVDLFHSPFRALPARSEFSGPTILTVHDLIPLAEAPESHNRQILETTLRLLDPERSWALCVSEHTRRELCAAIGLPPERVIVSPLAAEDVFRPKNDPAEYRAFLQKFQLPDAPFFLSVSNPQPRKNIPFLIRCFQEFAADHPGHHLVLAGSRQLGWGHDAVDRQIEEAPAVRDRIHFLGAVTDEELAVAYGHCLAFVFPSLQEGFGLPPLEAMQCGAPVMASRTTSLPEVVGDAGLLLSPTDAPAFVAALRRVSGDAALRSQMAAASLRQAGKFSWTKTARIVEDTYRQAWLQRK